VGCFCFGDFLVWGWVGSFVVLVLGFWGVFVVVGGCFGGGWGGVFMFWFGGGFFFCFGGGGVVLGEGGVWRGMGGFFGGVFLRFWGGGVVLFVGVLWGGLGWVGCLVLGCFCFLWRLVVFFTFFFVGWVCWVGWFLRGLGLGLGLGGFGGWFFWWVFMVAGGFWGHVWFLFFWGVWFGVGVGFLSLFCWFSVVCVFVPGWFFLGFCCGGGPLGFCSLFLFWGVWGFVVFVFFSGGVIIFVGAFELSWVG